MRLIVLPSASALNTRIGPRPERDSRVSNGVTSMITLRPSNAALAAEARTRSIAPVGK